VMRRTLSNVPLPARLVMPIIAPRVLAATLGGSTAPDSAQDHGVVKPHSREVGECVT
jgi:hypothetical protein